MLDDKAMWRAVLAAAALAMTGAAHAEAAASAPSPGSAEMTPHVDCKPRYPAAALRAQVQGVTTLVFHVEATGKLTQIDIVGSSGPTREHRLLDQAAAAALSRCPFTAATDADGRPIDSVLTVHYTWLLQ